MCNICVKHSIPALNMSITGVLHMYYRYMNCMCNTQNTTHVLDMYQTYNKHGAHLLVYGSSVVFSETLLYKGTCFSLDVSHVKVTDFSHAPGREAILNTQQKPAMRLASYVNNVFADASPVQAVVVCIPTIQADSLAKTLTAI